MKDKKYLVIGGSKGIGLAIVHQLLENGAHVEVVSRSKGELPAHERLTHVTGDVLDEDFDIDLKDGIEGMVYCPGSITLKPFRSLKPQDFQKDFDLNVLGAVKSIRSAQRALKKGDHPSIVLFSTVAVQQGMAFHASIATAKSALEGLTRSLAAEFAPKIRVNAVAPSLTDTQLAEKLLSSPDKREASANRHPLRKVGTPEDIANMATFLLSEKSSWMSGQILGVDGGLSRLRI